MCACLQAEAQRKLAGELTGLVDSSKGIRSAVDVVINYQQRSDSGGLGHARAGCCAVLAAGFGEPCKAKQLQLTQSQQQGHSPITTFTIHHQTAVLMRLLGKSYTLEDAAFYAVGVLAAWAAGISPATAKVGSDIPACHFCCKVAALGLHSNSLLHRCHSPCPAAYCPCQCRRGCRWWH